MFERIRELGEDEGVREFEALELLPEVLSVFESVPAVPACLSASESLVCKRARRVSNMATFSRLSSHFVICGRTFLWLDARHAFFAQSMCNLSNISVL